MDKFISKSEKPISMMLLSVLFYGIFIGCVHCQSFTTFVVKPGSAVHSSSAKSKDFNSRLRKLDTLVSSIQSMHIESKVTSRFMNTEVTSIIENASGNDDEVTFSLQIPETAFISNFTMFVDGTLFVGEVLEKEAAQDIYNAATESGETAGLISAEEGTFVRSFVSFVVAINVAASSSATFTLSYQELLVRELGEYSIQISVRPDQVVDDLEIDVFIYEPEGIKYITAAAPEGGTATAVIIHEDTQTKHVLYYPSTLQQDAGLDGELIISYDVAHNKTGGIVQMDGDYFVHFFSPSGLAELNKNILFIIDISGSMGSMGKMDQAQDALIAIFDQLDTNDGFGILVFDDQITLWKQTIVQATTANIETAKSWAQEYLVADGATNINDALVTGISIMKSIGNSATGKAPIIVFLTDGEPTEGVTDTSEIRQNVKDTADGEISLFCLAFGYGISFEFLQILSYENNGDAQMIYAESDAALQLETFYSKISSPDLLDVRCEYPGDIIIESTLTQTSFAQYFDGSELVIAGKLRKNAGNLTAVVYGQNAVEEIALVATIIALPSTSSNSIGAVIERATEKLWVYLKITDLVKFYLIETDEDEKASLKAMAVNLSIEYNLVTPFTSMVVVQQDTDSYIAVETTDIDTDIESSTMTSSSSTNKYAHKATHFISFSYALWHFIFSH